MSETGAQVNGPSGSKGKFIDGVDPDDPNYIKNLQRPAEVKEDLQQMENRSRVKMVLSSEAFRDELEQIVQEHLECGPYPETIMALKQITDLLIPQARGTFGNLGRAGAVIPINDLRGTESMGFSKGEKLLRCKLAALYRLVDLCGWSQGIYNHISARVSSDDEHFLINPFGMLYSEVTASSLVKVDVNGSVIEQGSSQLGVNKAGFTLHSAIHQARPDIKCIVHMHTPSAVAVSAMKCGFLPLSQEALTVGNVSYHDYKGIFVDLDERELLARNLGVHNKVLFLRNHGLVACGETIEETFHFVINVMDACEAQVRAIPAGIDNIILPSEESRQQAFRIANQGGGGVETTGKKWKVGEMEFEALMRTLDNSGYRTGYIYKMPMVKQEKKERTNSEVEIPPTSSSFSYMFDGDETSKYSSPLKAAMERQKKAYKAGWLTTPNAYKKTEVEEIGTTTPKKITKWVSEGESPNRPGSTPLKIDSPNQFAPQGENPKEFKEKQKSIKKDYYEDKVSAGPQSKILEGMSWDEAQKAKDGQLSGAGDQLIVVGAASKGIIQRDHQHNAVVYRQYYAANPFENMSEADIEKYQREVQRKEAGEPEPEPEPEPVNEVQPEPQPQPQIEDSNKREPVKPETTEPEGQDAGLARLADKVVQTVIHDALAVARQGKGQQTLTGDTSFDAHLSNQSVMGGQMVIEEANNNGSSDSRSRERIKLKYHPDCSHNHNQPAQNHTPVLSFEQEVYHSRLRASKTDAQAKPSATSSSKASKSPHPEDEYVSIQVNPIHLYHGQTQGRMKIKFSIQSTVRRRISAEIEKGSSIEEIYAAVTNPVVYHYGEETVELEANQEMEKTVDREDNFQSSFSRYEQQPVHLEQSTAFGSTERKEEERAEAFGENEKENSRSFVDDIYEVANGDQLRSEANEVTSEPNNSQSKKRTQSLYLCNEVEAQKKSEECPIEVISALEANHYPKYHSDSSKKRLKKKTTKSKKKAKLKKTRIPLTPVEEYFEGTVEEIEEFEALLQNADDSFERLLITAEDSLLLDAQSEVKSAHSEVLNLTEFSGIVPLTNDESGEIGPVESVHEAAHGNLKEKQNSLNKEVDAYSFRDKPITSKHVDSKNIQNQASHYLGGTIGRSDTSGFSPERKAENMSFGTGPFQKKTDISFSPEKITGEKADIIGSPYATGQNEVDSDQSAKLIINVNTDPEITSSKKKINNIYNWSESTTLHTKVNKIDSGSPSSEVDQNRTDRMEVSSERMTEGETDLRTSHGTIYPKNDAFATYPKEIDSLQPTVVCSSEDLLFVDALEDEESIEDLAESQFVDALEDVNDEMIEPENFIFEEPVNENETDPEQFPYADEGNDLYIIQVPGLFAAIPEKNFETVLEPLGVKQIERSSFKAAHAKEVEILNTKTFLTQTNEIPILGPLHAREIGSFYTKAPARVGKLPANELAVVDEPVTHKKTETDEDEHMPEKEVKTVDSKPLPKAVETTKYESFQIREMETSKDEPMPISKTRMTVGETVPITKIETSRDEPLLVRKRETVIGEILPLKNIEIGVNEPLSERKRKSAIVECLQVTKRERSIDGPLAVQKRETAIDAPLPVKRRETVIDEPLSVKKLQTVIDEPLPLKEIQTSVNDPLPIKKREIIIDEPLPVNKIPTLVNEPSPVKKRDTAIEEPLPPKEVQTLVNDPLPIKKRETVIDEPLPVNKIQTLVNEPSRETAIEEPVLVKELQTVVHKPLPVKKRETGIDEPMPTVISEPLSVKKMDTVIDEPLPMTKIEIVVSEPVPFKAEVTIRDEWEPIRNKERVLDESVPALKRETTRDETISYFNQPSLAKTDSDVEGTKPLRQSTMVNKTMSGDSSNVSVPKSVNPQQRSEPDHIQEYRETSFDDTFHHDNEMLGFEYDIISIADTCPGTERNREIAFVPKEQNKVCKKEREPAYNEFHAHDIELMSDAVLAKEQEPGYCETVLSTRHSLGDKTNVLCRYMDTVIDDFKPVGIDEKESNSDNYLPIIKKMATIDDLIKNKEETTFDMIPTKITETLLDDIALPEKIENAFYDAVSINKKETVMNEDLINIHRNEGRKIKDPNQPDSASVPTGDPKTSLSKENGNNLELHSQSVQGLPGQIQSSLETQDHFHSDKTTEDIVSHGHGGSSAFDLSPRKQRDSETFNDLGQDFHSSSKTVLDEFHLRKHNELMNLPSAKSFFTPPVITVYPVTESQSPTESMPPLPDTVDVPSVSDEDDIAQRESRNRRQISSTPATTSQIPQVKRKWKPKPRDQKRNLSQSQRDNSSSAEPSEAPRHTSKADLKEVRNLENAPSVKSGKNLEEFSRSQLGIAEDRDRKSHKEDPGIKPMKEKHITLERESAGRWASQKGKRGQQERHEDYDDHKDKLFPREGDEETRRDFGKYYDEKEQKDKDRGLAKRDNQEEKKYSSEISDLTREKRVDPDDGGRHGYDRRLREKKTRSSDYGDNEESDIRLSRRDKARSPLDYDTNEERDKYRRSSFRKGNARSPSEYDDKEEGDKDRRSFSRKGNTKYFPEYDDKELKSKRVSSQKDNTRSSEYDDEERHKHRLSSRKGNKRSFSDLDDREERDKDRRLTFRKGNTRSPSGYDDEGRDKDRRQPRKEKVRSLSELDNNEERDKDRRYARTPSDYDIEERDRDRRYVRRDKTKFASDYDDFEESGKDRRHSRKERRDYSSKKSKDTLTKDELAFDNGDKRLDSEVRLSKKWKPKTFKGVDDQKNRDYDKRRLPGEPRKEAQPKADQQADETSGYESKGRKSEDFSSHSHVSQKSQYEDYHLAGYKENVDELHHEKSGYVDKRKTNPIDQFLDSPRYEVDVEKSPRLQRRRGGAIAKEAQSKRSNSTKLVPGNAKLIPSISSEHLLTASGIRHHKSSASLASSAGSRRSRSNSPRTFTASEALPINVQLNPLTGEPYNFTHPLMLSMESLYSGSNVSLRMLRAKSESSLYAQRHSPDGSHNVSSGNQDNVSDVETDLKTLGTGDTEDMNTETGHKHMDGTEKKIDSDLQKHERAENEKQKKTEKDTDYEYEPMQGHDRRQSRESYTDVDMKNKMDTKKDNRRRSGKESDIDVEKSNRRETGEEQGRIQAREAQLDMEEDKRHFKREQQRRRSKRDSDISSEKEGDDRFESNRKQGRRSRRRNVPNPNKYTEKVSRHSEYSGHEKTKAILEEEYEKVLRPRLDKAVRRIAQDETNLYRKHTEDYEQQTECSRKEISLDDLGDASRVSERRRATNGYQRRLDNDENTRAPLSQETDSPLLFNPIDSEMPEKDSDDDLLPPPKKGFLSRLSCVGGRSSEAAKKSQLAPSKAPLEKSAPSDQNKKELDYYEEGEKRKTKKLSKDKQKENKGGFYFRQEEDIQDESDPDLNETHRPTKNYHETTDIFQAPKSLSSFAAESKDNKDYQGYFYQQDRRKSKDSQLDDKNDDEEHQSYEEKEPKNLSRSVSNQVNDKLPRSNDRYHLGTGTSKEVPLHSEHSDDENQFAGKIWQPRTKRDKQSKLRPRSSKSLERPKDNEATELIGEEVLTSCLDIRTIKPMETVSYSFSPQQLELDSHIDNLADALVSGQEVEPSTDISGMHYVKRHERRLSHDNGSVPLSNDLTPRSGDSSPVRRRVSQVSLTGSSSSRPRSASTVSNPLIYQPWRAKARRRSRSMSVSEMMYAAGFPRPRNRSHSVGEITHNSTVASHVARRRSRSASITEITSRMYQPRLRSHSRGSLGDTSLGSVAPFRQRKISGSPSFPAERKVVSAPPVKRSDSERQPSKNPELIEELDRKSKERGQSERRPKARREELGDDKPVSPSKSDTLKSTDSASGGETLEEHSSKEGSPTKEHPAAKDKKKKKKFRIPSFSKKKNKESKESAI